MFDRRDGVWVFIVYSCAYKCGNVCMRTLVTYFRVTHDDGHIIYRCHI